MMKPERNGRKPSARRLTVVALVVAIHILVARRSSAENSVDAKFMYYGEDGNRIRVLAPSFAVQHEFSPALTIKIDGIFNAISGATPTGEPPRAAAPAPAPAPVYSAPAPSPAGGGGAGGGGGDDGGEAENDTPIARLLRAGGFHALSAATPVVNPTPTPPASTPAAGPAPAAAPASGGAPAASPDGEVPTVNFDDTRYGLNLEVGSRLGRHTPAVQLSYSVETDYLSAGLALRDAMDFNQKNTTLLLGAALTYDLIQPVTDAPDETKITVDAMVGVSQVLDRRTLLSANLTLSHVEGFLSDPYKVVELNGVLVPELRPDSKDKQIVYVSLTRFVELLRGSAEGSYRYYRDSFGIDAHTLSLAWHQRLGRHFVLRPMVRYYVQSEADFYGVRFTGTPEYYSADYRVSALTALSYGLKFVWMPTERLSFDVSFDRYAQSGSDSETPDAVYPSANVIMGGARLWF